ncbi:MAG: hypothetical protein Q8P75_00455 [bacterium]|nr:hypothetical protein [bacterium]
MKLIPEKNFLMLPNRLLEKYLLILKPSEFELLLILWYLSHRFSTDKFHYTDRQITKRFGLSPAAINRARKKLRELGLIKYESGFRIDKVGVATRYKLLPDEKLRKWLLIRTNQKYRLDKPP